MVAMRFARRGFQSRAEHSDWIRRVLRSRKLPPPTMMETVDRERTAPFLFSVDPFAPQVVFRHALSAPAHSSSASMLEATWPLSTNMMLQNAVSDIEEGGVHGWSAMRLGKFYEALDALTGDVAHKHVSGGTDDYALVTGGHYHSIKLARALRGVDMTLRCYVTHTGAGRIARSNSGWLSGGPALALGRPRSNPTLSPASAWQDPLDILPLSLAGQAPFTLPLSPAGS